MNGSYIAEAIEREMKRNKYYKNKKRAKCIVDEKKQCYVCKYRRICEDFEYERNDSIESNKQYNR